MNTYFSPNGMRHLYYPLLNDDGRSSLQMMTVMDMNSNTLILDEIVLNNHKYRLEQHEGDFYLPDFGPLDETKPVRKGCIKECTGVTDDWRDLESEGIKVDGNLFDS